MTTPKNIGIILFPGFQLLDICGPLDALNLLAMRTTLNLTILAATLDPVPTAHALHDEQNSNFSQSIVPTHTFATAPDNLEVLIIPGGFGCRKDENIAPVTEFLKAYYEKLRWCLTVCTGSMVLAKSGVLDGRRATTNKHAFKGVKENHPKVEWVGKARWVVDGNIWTSSGVTAGMDLIFAWIAEVWGEETAGSIADQSEYERNKDAGNDPFAEKYGVV